MAAGVGAPWCGSSFGQTSLAPIDMMKLAPWTALVPASSLPHPRLAMLRCFFVEGTRRGHCIDWIDWLTASDCKTATATLHCR